MKTEFKYKAFKGKGFVQGKKPDGFWPTVHFTQDGQQTACGVGLFKEAHLTACKTNWVVVKTKATCRTCKSKVAALKPVKKAAVKKAKAVTAETATTEAELLAIVEANALQVA